MKNYLFVILLAVIFQSANAQLVNFTPDVYDVSRVAVSGDNVAWLQNNGSGKDVYVYYGATGQTIQVTNDAADDNNIAIDGDNVVWNSSLDGDHEIYLFDGSTTTQITNNTVADALPDVSGNNIAWVRNSGDNREIIFYNGSTETPLTTDAFPDFEVKISGNKVVWIKWDAVGEQYHVGYYDGSTTSNLSGWHWEVDNVKIDGDNIIWSEKDQETSTHWTLQYYDGSTETQLFGFLENNSTCIDGDNIGWASTGGGVSYYNGTSTVHISQPMSSFNYVRISGNNLSWKNTSNDFLMIYDGTDVHTVDYNNLEFGATGAATMSGNDIYWLAQPDTAQAFYYNLYKYTLTDFTASFTFDADICAYDPDTFINTTTTSIPLEYSWDVGTISITEYLDSSLISTLGYTSEAVHDIYMIASDGIKKDTFESVLNVHPIPSITLDSTREESCFGLCDGAIYLSSDAEMPATYQWSNDSTGPSIIGVCQGSYSATVTSAYGCSQNGTSAITDISVSGPVQGLGSTMEKVNTNCNKSNGSAEVAVTGGIPPYSYLWSNDSTKSTLTNLSDDKYFLTVTDDNGCEKTDSAIIEIELPDTTNICLVSVDSVTGNNMIVWEKIHDNAVDYYNVYKEVSANNYSVIGSVLFNDLTVFIDSSSNPEVQADYYKISAVDTCGNESVLSPYHKTIHLNINMAIGNGANLQWNHYEDELNGIAFGSGGTGLYYIYRGTTSSNLQLHHSLSSNLESWTDTDTTQLYYYRIAAEKIDTCDPAGLLKASNGPFSRSLSNLEDNRQQSNNINKNTAIKLKVYPNPTNGIATISFANERNEQFSFRLLDISGKVIREESNLEGSEYILRNSNIPAGYYIIEISYSEKYRAPIIIK